MQESKRKKTIVIVVLFLLVFVVALTLVWIFVINKTLVPGKSGHYTYRYADDAPDSFNPLIWSDSSEREVLSYTTSSLYDISSSEENTFEFSPLLAESFPVDVTEEFAGNEVYGVPADASEGYAYRVTIRKDALWEDGTAITTTDFVYSLQLYLSEESLHQSDYYNSYLSLANAANYVDDSYINVYDSDKGYADVDDSDLYFSLTHVNALFSTCSLKEYYTWFFQDRTTIFTDEDGHNIYEALLEAVGDEEYTILTDEIKTLLQSFCVNYGLSDEEGYKRLCFYLDEGSTVAWDSIGFIAEDEYTMTFVLSKKVDASEFMYALSDFLLIKQDLYEANAQGYGSTVETYQSYGPYIISSFDENGMMLERNENWFGYSDDSYDDQYQTTDIEISYNLTNEEAFTKFTEGNLDDLKITGDIADSYDESEYLYMLSDMATDILMINTDLLELIENSSNGESHTILAYKDFRHAVALALDRGQYLDALDVEGEESYGLIGTSYLADISNMRFYRYTSYASEIMEAIYGEADENGLYSTYDLEKASLLLQNAYDACMMDGNIQGTDAIVINFYSENDGADEYLQEVLDEAAVGTSLEGKIIIRMVDSVEEADIKEAVVGGNEGDLCKYMEYFLDTTEEDSSLGILKCSITLNDEKISMTYRQWYQELTLGKYRSASFDEQIKILAYLEKGLLTEYGNIPLYSVTEKHLRSQRIVFGDGQSANSEMEYKDIRYITYTMDDSEWAKYCRKNNYELKYQ